MEAIRHWSKLRTFRMTGCVHITPIILRTLANHCPSLEVLIAPRNVRFSKTCPDINLPMTAIIRSCKNLSKLDLSDYVTTNDNLLKVIIQEAPNLKYLKLQNCNQLTGTEFATWWKDESLQNLEILDVSGCTNLDQDFLDHVWSRCKRIEKLITAVGKPAMSNTTYGDRCIPVQALVPAVTVGVCWYCYITIRLAKRLPKLTMRGRIHLIASELEPVQKSCFSNVRRAGISCLYRTLNIYEM